MASKIPAILGKHRAQILEDWVREQIAVIGERRVQPKSPELRAHCEEFLRVLGEALESGKQSETSVPWKAMRSMLADLSRARSRSGFTPKETATFVFSLKKPLFEAMRKEIMDPRELADELWTATMLLDELGLYTTEVHQKAHEEIIVRQQQEMLELSTPVVKLWDGILALPLIGTLDSSRSQVVMESLLQRMIETGAPTAIIDITGVPTVDTLVAQHLLKTVAAARLMGAECIISGIRPQIAATIVHLGIDLGTVTTKATLADAFALALRRRGVTIAVAPVQPQV